jgi:hypothetical protein
MLIIFGFALLVLAIGMVVLFAMFGELSSRVAEAPRPARSTEIIPLENANLGHVPETWPAALPRDRDGRLVLLVLSTACASCEDIAEQLRADPSYARWSGMAIAISTSHHASGEDFVDRHGLGHFPYYIDTGGSWLTGELGVQFSPCALVFNGGQLVAAYIFHDVGALQARLSQPEAQGAQEQQHREAVLGDDSARR